LNLKKHLPIEKDNLNSVQYTRREIILHGLFFPPEKIINLFMPAEKNQQEIKTLQ